MFIEERHQKIAETIKNQGKITIAEIAEHYNISDESARRDLRILEQKGVCKRTHGGAILPLQIGMRAPANRVYDQMPIYDNYKRIAENAVKLICENDIIYLTSGSFGHIMLLLLPRNIHFTIVVNSVDLGQELRNFNNVDVYVIGGKMRESGSLVDSLATEFASRLHFDICFITGSGLTADFGLSNGTDETATFQRTIIKNSKKKCLLMPSSKIGSNAFVKVCDTENFDFIITDWDCVEDQISAVEDKGVKVIIAEEEK